MTRAESEAVCTWTSPPTPPTMGSSSKTFTISTDEAGSSMVSESQTCKEESRNELKKRKKYECGHYCQNRAYILCPQLYCHRASVASTAGVTASYIMTNTRDDSCYITTNAKSKLSTAVNGIAGEHSPSAGDVLQANQLVWVFHGSCSSWQ